MTGIQLSWTFSGDNAAQFVVYRTRVSSPSFPGDYSEIAQTDGDTTSYLDPDANLLTGEEYTYRVTALNSGGESPPSNPAAELRPLPGVANLRADASVEDELTAISDDTINYGNYRWGFRVSGSGDAYTDLGTTGQDTPQITITGLLDGEEYDIRARTETEHTTTAYQTISPVTLLPAPTNFAASIDLSTDTVSLSWTDNADNEDNYVVERRELSTNSGTPTAWSDIATLAADTTTYSETVATGEYEYRVRAETEHVTALSNTDTVLNPTPIPDVNEWIVTASNLDDPDTNVPPRIEDGVYDVDPVVDTANPFGDYSVVKMDDRGGEKFDLYNRGTRVDVYAPNTPDTPRFTGYVVERRGNEQQGADVLEVEAYSLDQFLRRNNVSNDQTGNTITEALADIIQTDTPVTYNAANIEVGEDQALTRSYRGEKVENVLRDLAFKSNNEDFGVNSDLEFFFRPRETEHIDRGIDRTLWFNYDIPELGKEAVNEVEVWFNDGNESVIVDDGTDKLDLQDSLGLDSPGTQRAELNRPFLTDIADAEDEGRKYLEFRNATLSGTVTTFGLYDAEPGDTIDISIPSRGIDSEFVIAALEYRWGTDQTILTIVEKRGDVDDILTELNDSVQRQEMEGADRDATKNRITTTNATGVVSVSVDADGSTPAGDRFVNDGRRLVRDAWTGQSYSAISTITVGDDGSALSRSNTSLGNQTNSASASQSLPDATSVEFNASITQTGVEEVGLEAADGTLVARAVFDSPIDVDGTVTVTLDVSNDDSVSRGVLTTDGQTAVRDVLASNSPALPDAYAYGSDATAVSESDTALGNELVEVGLDEVLIQDASTQSEWEGITTIGATDPFRVNNGALEIAQSSFTTEGEDWDTGSDSGTGGIDSEYSGGIAASFDGTGDVEYNFNLDYDIPAGNVSVYIRINTPGTGGANVRIELDGTEIDEFLAGASIGSVNWRDVANSPFSGSGYSGGLSSGAHTLRLYSTTSDSVTTEIDVVAVLDNRYSYTIDNDNGGSSGYLDGPELYPDAAELALNTATTRRNLDEARFDLTANDVSNNFYIEVANDGSTFTRVNNSQTGTVSFAGLEKGVDTNVGLSRYGSRTSATPQTGYLGQEIDTWMLYANPDATFTDDIGATLTRAIVAPGTITGSTVREAGLKSGSTLLTRHVLAEFTVQAGQRVSSSETTRFTSDN